MMRGTRQKVAGSEAMDFLKIPAMAPEEAEGEGEVGERMARTLARIPRDQRSERTRLLPPMNLPEARLPRSSWR